MHSSPSNSRPASPEPSDTMQIFVKNVSGNTIAMTVPSSLTIQNLTTLLSVRTSLPESDLRLVHAGKHLSSSDATLSDYHISRESTLHLAIPLRGGMPPKKIKCTYKDCREGAQRIIGDCGFCNGHYCGKHRLLEDHKCDGLEDCKKESHDRNAAQLNAERTQVIKGI
ncbi:Ubiquitin-60S ribosomal protein L40 [Lachnellula occidentalis]|uniref:Ubiquitin-60S ribosomal protein L40 n=1 Tax=Lachnellula occidentalis TaxID=215460 RepID=A0A8H8S7A7_9HELO|nr:Ubiquitin-60S ribosomal protein L40 [Lachnellula occidentalis]